MNSPAGDWHSDSSLVNPTIKLKFFKQNTKNLIKKKVLKAKIIDSFGAIVY